MSKLSNAMNNKTTTGNGEVAYKSTLNPLIDFYYLAPAMFPAEQNKTTFDYFNEENTEVIDLFAKAFQENPDLAFRLLLELRDIRSPIGGKGKKNVTAILYRYLAITYPRSVEKHFDDFVKFGSYKDLLWLMSTPVEKAMINFFYNQVCKDYEKLLNNDHNNITLAAKWFPSENAGKRSKLFFSKFMSTLFVNPKQAIPTVRKMVSSLRRHLNVVEQEMSANEWNKVVYEAVPSRASFMYRNSFLKHDKTRYELYLNAVENGKVKMNVNHVEMYELFANPALNQGRFQELVKEISSWFPDNYSILPVLDSSSSMTSWEFYGGKEISSKYTPYDIACGMAIACALSCNGPFKGDVVNFNNTSQIYNFHTHQIKLHEIKHRFTKVFNNGGSTNLLNVFTNILSTAKQYRLQQKDLPGNILILSDMQFDKSGFRFDTYHRIEQLFTSAGYSVPRIIYWNINSQTMNVPVLDNQHNAIMVSGHSQNVFKTIVQDTMSPEHTIEKIVNHPRYIYISFF